MAFITVGSNLESEPYLEVNYFNNVETKKEPVSKYCKSCGAPTIFKCDYCGTFKVEPHEISGLTINEKRKLYGLPEI